MVAWMTGILHSPTITAHRKYQQKAHENPSTQQSELLFILTVGSLLVYGGTPILYACYAATQSDKYSHRRTPLPLLTDMFGDWPLSSSAVVGVGITLLFTGLIATAIARIPPTLVPFHPRTKVVRYAAVTQASIWLVISSSAHYPAGDDVMDWVHNISTFVFMVSTVYMLFMVLSLCNFFVKCIFSELAARQREYGSQAATMEAWSRAETLRTTASWARTCLWIAAAGVLGATVCVSVIALGDWKPPDAVGTTGTPKTTPSPQQSRQYSSSSFAPQALWQSLVACELVILFFSGLGYGLVIYTYDGIEKAAEYVISTTTVDAATSRRQPSASAAEMQERWRL